LKCPVSEKTFKAVAAVLLSAVFVVPNAVAGQAPEIRLSAANAVPACVTPARLMSFLGTRNHNLDPRFKDIALYYKQHGERWNVRWDYAFYQMAVETNFLTYRRPDGKWGDVDPKQNNFAGIGTTGGGVPGDRFPDVTTGVLGQIQHLVAYSGEHMERPVAARTQLKQDDIIVESQKLGRPVRFSDLARRWAVDPKYGSSIEWVADGYRTNHCKGGDTNRASKESLPWEKASVAAAPVPAVRPVTKRVQDAGVQSKQNITAAPAPAPAVQPAARTVWVSSPRGQPKSSAEPRVEGAAVAVTPAALQITAADEPGVPAGAVAPRAGPNAAVAPPSGLGVKPLLKSPCRVTTASYGGKKTVLIKAAVNGEQLYTVLTVLDGFEKSMTETFLKSRAPAGEMLGEFPDQSSALAQARQMCPSS
jgi:Mannosyl-glycoprotein endo-beta-N-acetylglucosaminidase